MDKDVKRSLLLWPTIASTAIIAATTLPMCWDNPAKDSARLVASSAQSLVTAVRWTGCLLVGDDDRTREMARTSSCSGQPLVVANTAMARSLQGNAESHCASHRPNHGTRGLALPTRLRSFDYRGGIAFECPAPEESLEDVALKGNFGTENGVSFPASADLVASSKAIARTLLAPVLDPVAELAGYPGLTFKRDPADLASTTSPIGPLRPNAPLALPSRLSPGLEDPFTATGTASFVSNASQHWMQSLNPVASWNAIALGNGLAAQPALLNARPEASSLEPSPTESLIPRSVEYLGRPSYEAAEPKSDPPASSLSKSLNKPPRTFRVLGNSWPQPKQLCQDLAMIAADADAARVAIMPNKQTFASVELGQTEPSMIRDLVADGNLQQSAGQNSSPVHRHATSIVMGRWADKVEATIEELQSLPRIGDPRSGKLIRQLASLSEAGLQLAERVPAREQQIRWLRAAHACSRRSAVWGPIWRLARDGEAMEISKGSEAGRERYLALVHFSADQSPAARDESVSNQVPQLVGAVRMELNQTGDELGWHRFLLLDELELASSSSDPEQRALVAQRFLSRLDHHLLTAEHRKWLERASVTKLADGIHPWTARPIDYAELLSDLERGETDAIDLSAIKVGAAFQSLRFSDELAAANVAKAIDVNYRNANVRTAISVKLLDRLLPPVEPKTSPIRTRLLGNEVRGTSRVDSRLGLTLTPTRDSWNLNVRTDGDVNTDSRSGESGVTVLTRGHSVFNASTPLIIRTEGYTIGSTQVGVTGSQQLRGIRSKYDGWPLVGSLVRGIAESRFEQALPIANRKSRNQIQSQVTNELQTQLTEKTAKGHAKLDEFVFGPLGRMNLEPKVIDMRTTSERLVARYRLAGDWQLASNTPRPRAWNDSWMSLQVHQSAFNNTLEQLMPTGEAKSVGQFYGDTMALFGQTDAELPNDVPSDAVIEFAATRPVTIEMNDGRMTLTLRVVKLSQADRPGLKRFIVRAVYRPEVNGLSAKFVRDGHLSISGPGMSMRQRIPIRALFNKVLSETRAIPLTMPRLVEHPAIQDLAISQMELRDGWLAFAISPNTSPRVAIGTRALGSTKVVTR